MSAYNMLLPLVAGSIDSTQRKTLYCMPNMGHHVYRAQVTSCVPRASAGPALAYVIFRRETKRLSGCSKQKPAVQRYHNNQMMNRIPHFSASKTTCFLPNTKALRVLAGGRSTNRGLWNRLQKAHLAGLSTGRCQLRVLNWEQQQQIRTSTFIQRVALVPIIVIIVTTKNIICGTIPFVKSTLKIGSLYPLSKQQTSPVYTSCTLIVKYT